MECKNSWKNKLYEQFCSYIKCPEDQYGRYWEFEKALDQKRTLKATILVRSSWVLNYFWGMMSLIFSSAHTRVHWQFGDIMKNKIIKRLNVLCDRYSAAYWYLPIAERPFEDGNKSLWVDFVVTDFFLIHINQCDWRKFHHLKENLFDNFIGIEFISFSDGIIFKGDKNGPNCSILTNNYFIRMS